MLILTIRPKTKREDLTHFIMKKFIFTALLLLFTICIHAQQKKVMRYNYSAKLVLDKTKPEKINETVFVLDIDSTRSSRFLKLALLERKRAAVEVKTKEDLMQILGTYRPKTFFYIFHSHGITTTYSKIERIIYSYDNLANTITWEINPHQKKWNDYTVQKATTVFEGRQWHVLFTSEIPLTEGPYKFKNLPGFVVKAWDEEHHYEFEFLNSEQLTIDNWELINPKESITKITANQYEKALRIQQNKNMKDFFIEMNPANEATLPPEFNERIGLRSNPIYKVE